MTSHCCEKGFLHLFQSGGSAGQAGDICILPVHILTGLGKRGIQLSEFFLKGIYVKSLMNVFLADPPPRYGSHLKLAVFMFLYPAGDFSDQHFASQNLAGKAAGKACQKMTDGGFMGANRVSQLTDLKDSCYLSVIFRLFSLDRLSP